MIKINTYLKPFCFSFKILLFPALFCLLFLLYTCGTARVHVVSGDPQADPGKIIKPSFWLNQVEDPDRVILSASGIRSANRRNLKKNYTWHPLNEPDRIKGKVIRRRIRADLEWIASMKKYDENNCRINGREFIKEMRRITAFEKIPDRMKVRFGLMVRPAYLRAFPTDKTVIGKPDDLPFDLLQHSFLDIGEPVALYHVSQDGEWGYILSFHTGGWVRLKDLAWTFDKSVVEKYTETEPFVMITDWKVPLYRDPGCKKLLTLAHMGSRLPLAGKGKVLTVTIPVRKDDGALEFREAFFRQGESISLEYLRMTPRNIALQSFRMLGQPYGWGGLEFQTDCSYFIHVVFRTMGLFLPRNSRSQVTSLGNHRVLPRNKDKFFNDIRPFQTLLFLPRPEHIMLYIGRHNGRHYVIHNKWSYKKQNGEKEKEILLKKVLVSDLGMGSESSEGSLFDRVSRAGVLR